MTDPARIEKIEADHKVLREDLAHIKEHVEYIKTAIDYLLAAAKVEEKIDAVDGE